MVVWLNKAMTVLYQGFCYIKNIRIYMVIWTINNNAATDVTHMQKIMVAFENLVRSQGLAVPCPSENSGPPW